MDQLPEVGHFTPAILVERNNNNARNRFSHYRLPTIPLDSFIRKGSQKCDILDGLQIAADFWRRARRFVNCRGIFNLPIALQNENGLFCEVPQVAVE
jgi:hypothetical protein